jgi:hypothetical protein
LGLALAVSLICQQSILAQQVLPNDPNAPVQRPDLTQPGNPGDTQEKGIEVQGRGPVHEAYAQPNGNAKPGPLVTKQPPPPIPEEPAAERPQGDNVQWIPGYWAWDPSRNDYLWVSGFWRNEPPGRKWVPGHWSQADSGWRWISGLWADASLPNLQYLQEKPPDSLENGPSVPAPDDNSLWVAGHWEWRDGQFVWRPGYWADGQPGMVWNQPDYYYTPSGYVYNTGYWDYDLDNRGLLFAPVYFTEPLWTYPGWYYRPWYYVGWRGLLGSLWWGRGGYWFGDYYGGYLGYGFRPWFSFGLGYRDPLFNFYRWHYGNGFARWHNGMRDEFHGRVNGTLARPGRTVAGINGRGGVNSNQIVHSLNHYTGGHLTTLSTSQLATHQNAAQQFRSVSQQRSQFERMGGAVNGRSSVSLNSLPGSRTMSNAGVRTSSYSQWNGNVHYGTQNLGNNRFGTQTLGNQHMGTQSFSNQRFGTQTFGHQNFGTRSYSQFGRSMNNFNGFNNYRTQTFRGPSHPGSMNSMSFHSQSFNGIHSYSGGSHSSFGGSSGGGGHFGGGGGHGGGGHGGGHH